MANPGIVSTSLVEDSSGTSIIIDAPASIAAGNELIMIVAMDSLGTASWSSSGWTLIDNTVGNRAVFRKVATGSEPGTYTISTGSANVSTATAVILNIADGIYDTIGSVSAAASNPTAPGVTAANDNSLLFDILTANVQDQTSNPAPNPSTGWTSVVNELTGSVVSIWSKTVTAGATGNIANTTSNSGVRASLLSIKPATVSLATGRADETEIALALSRRAIITIGRANEVDDALAVAAIAKIAVAATIETDSSLAVSLCIAIPPGHADESEQAFSLDLFLGNTPGIAVEVDTAASPNLLARVTIGLSIEHDAAVGAIASAVIQIGRSDEANYAMAIPGRVPILTPLGRRFSIAPSTRAMRRFNLTPSTRAMRRFTIEG